MRNFDEQPWGISVSGVSSFGRSGHGLCTRPATTSQDESPRVRTNHHKSGRHPQRYETDPSRGTPNSINQARMPGGLQEGDTPSRLWMDDSVGDHTKVGLRYVPAASDHDLVVTNTESENSGYIMAIDGDLDQCV